MTGRFNTLVTAVWTPGSGALRKHGVKDCDVLVEQFQREDGPPSFVLSLNAAERAKLTEVGHVIYFDRWGNRWYKSSHYRAYRIGQKKCVLCTVPLPWDCRGAYPQPPGGETGACFRLLADGGEIALTEMKNDELPRSSR